MQPRPQRCSQRAFECFVTDSDRVSDFEQGKVVTPDQVFESATGAVRTTGRHASAPSAVMLQYRFD
jgi:hypothetical protein